MPGKASTWVADDLWERVRPLLSQAHRGPQGPERNYLCAADRYLVAGDAR